MTTRTIRYAGAALRDLGQIGEHSRKTWGVTQTRAYLKAIGDDVKALAQFPETGRKYEKLDSEIRKIRSGAHLVFYKIDADSILVVRILHDRMDVGGRIYE